MRPAMRFNQRGDTIVEVLVATVVISTVMAATFTLTNKATRINQAAQERTDVSNLMREQAELVKKGMVDNGRPSTTPLGQIATIVPTACRGIGSGTGFNATASGTSTTYASGPKKIGNFYYIWVERPASLNADSIDFTVRACWPGAGKVPVNISGLVIRVPRGGS